MHADKLCIPRTVSLGRRCGEAYRLYVCGVEYLRPRESQYYSQTNKHLHHVQSQPGKQSAAVTSAF